MQMQMQMQMQSKLRSGSGIHCGADCREHPNAVRARRKDKRNCREASEMQKPVQCATFHMGLPLVTLDNPSS